MDADPLAEMVDHYSAQDEGSRLTRSPHGRLEFLRTQSILRRSLPGPPARVLDVGGATGIHAKWLSEDGYDVVLIDPMPNHVAKASEIGTFACQLGDARNLDQPANSADAVLLLGPLYHLINRPDRVAALMEARRVLRPGGLVAAAAISRYLGLLELGARDDVTPGQIREEARVLESGEYEATLGFTHAHFHLPDELRGEVLDAGFSAAKVIGIEGPMWTSLDAYGIDRFDAFADNAIAVAELLEDDPSTIAMSAHMMATAFASLEVARASSS